MASDVEGELEKYTFQSHFLTAGKPLNTLKRRLLKSQRYICCVKIAIVVLCHSRTSHLSFVIDSLKKVRGIESSQVFFIAHSPSKAVVDIVLSSNLPNLYLHRIDQNFPSVKAAINNSTRVGCEMAFLNPEVSSCLVLEDDIVVSDDILELADKLLKLHSKKRKFRGINFYSIDTNEKVSVCAFVRLNYSFGWGWLITRKTFNQINYWTGKEDAHWDYFIEPFIRTGYLVAPVHSRVKNIGFDHTATHTKEGSWIGNEMEKSFILAKMENSERLVEISGAKYQTIRKDCLSVSELTKLDTWKLFILRCVSYSFYRMAIRGSTQMHFIWRETRNRIDNHFSAK